MRTDVATSLQLALPDPDGNCIRAEFKFDPALPVFAGHFPGNPLLPGVLQIEMVRHAAEILLKRKLWISRVENAKFSSVVLPGQPVSVEVKTSRDACLPSAWRACPPSVWRAGTFRAVGTVRVKETVAAKVTLVLAVPNRQQPKELAQ